MIKKADFSLSRRVYALNLKAMVEYTCGGHCWYYIPAVWYKRKNTPRNFQQGDIATCGAFGEIRICEKAGLTFEELFKLEHLNPLVEMLGRYDGKSFWVVEDLERQKEIITLLKPMLKTIPSFPIGYDGWYNIHSKGQ